MPESKSAGLTVPGERLDLLLDCLSFDLPAERLTALRIALLTEPDALDALLLAANRRLLGPAALDGLTAKGLIHPARKQGNGTLRSQLGNLVAAYQERREVLKAGLCDIIAALNAAGIEPLIIKGSVSLLTGQPAWRFQRDIDFVIEPGEADLTVKTLESIGFAIEFDDGLSADHHHLQPMWRKDMPVGVEPHLRINTGWARRVLPDELILPHARRQTFDGLKVRLLRDEHALVYGLVHHHFQHHGALFGVIGTKALVEYADGLRRLEGTGVDGLLALVDRRPRLSSVIELWTAAAMRLLCLTPPARLTPGRVAQARADESARRMLEGRVAPRLTALREEWRGIAAAQPGTDGVMGSMRDRANLMVQTIGDSLRHRDLIASARALKEASGILYDA